MKKKLLFTIPIAFFGLSINAQTTGTITTTIGDYFVSSVSPVNNTITANEATANWIDFYLADPTFTIKYDSLIDNTGGHATKNWTYDMGQLDTGMVIWAIFYDNSGNSFGYNYYQPNMIPTPIWLTSGYGSVSGINVNGNNVQMLGHFSFTSQNNSMPSDIPGLNGRPYNLVSPEITANIDFDCATGQATATNPNATFNLNIFNQRTYPYNYPLSTINALSLDSNFNPQIMVEGTYTPAPFEINWPLAKFYPLLPSPYPSLKIDGGLTIGAELKGKFLCDYNTTYSAWGIDTARITAKINATATLRAKADALIASASGTLVAKGSIGGGLEYSDFPSPNTNVLFGMDLEIAGAIDYKLGLGFLSMEGHLEKTFYQKTWGDQIRESPFYHQVYDNVDALGNYTQLTQSNPYLQTPDFFAQPNMSANDLTLYTVWLDHSGNNTEILFSKLNYQTEIFSTPSIVNSAEAISNPKVAMLPSGNALITWTQNRYTGSTFNTTTMNLTDLLQAQDIWATLYDKSNNSFATPVMINDDQSSLVSGRAEGNANIFMGKGSYGLITWVVNNDLTSNENADVWYCTVAETGSSVVLGVPSQLINLSGTNRSINISYYDSINAIATWIYDPDGLDSTLNNEVVFSEWTQTNQTSGTWSSLNTLISNNGSMSFDDVSLDFNDIYGAVSWTSTEYDLNGGFVKGIYADAWNPQTQNWAQASFDTSSVYNFAQPKVSVNNYGYVALTYQKVRLFDDTLSPDVGKLNLYLNESQNDPINWTTNNGNSFLGDPAVYVWDLNTTYGNQSKFYVITQEADTITGNAPVNPPNGVRFGNNYLNLVLRALDVTPTIVTDIPEPSSSKTFTKGNQFDFNLYPNPITVYSTIEYSLSSSSNVSIEIFDLMGRSVAMVFEGKQNAGTYKAIFEPNGLISGIYLCKVTVNNLTGIKKMVIAK